LALKPKRADFGIIPSDDPIAFHECSLIAKNVGNETLTIEDVHLPEGFSYTIIPRNIIESGASATLRITMNIRKVSGAVSETAHIISNDITEPEMSLPLAAEVTEERKAISGKPANAPDISFKQNAVDFGPIPRHQMIEYEFPFENIGDKPLKLYSIETRCICLTGTPTAWEIPPKGSAVIIARLEPYKYEGVKPWKSLLIKTNDPDEPAVSVSVSAFIVDAAVLDPQTLLLPNIPSGQAASAEVKLIQGGSGELVIKAISTSSPRISATSSQLEGEQKGYLLTVTVAPDMPVGKFEEVVTIHTNYDDYSAYGEKSAKPSPFYRDYSRLTLPVKGSVVGAVSVSPQMINFGSCVPGKPVSRKLILSTLSVPVEITSISLPEPGFRVSYAVLEKGRKYEITVEFAPEPPERQIESELVISTTTSRLVVPILATVKQGSQSSL